MRKLVVKVMGSEEAIKRFARAWKRNAANAETATIGVSSLAELTALLSPKRMELIRHVAQNPGLSVRALAQQLGRDDKNVHTGVSELEARQVLARDKAGLLKAPYDEIVIRAPLRDAA